MTERKRNKLNKLKEEFSEIVKDLPAKKETKRVVSESKIVTTHGSCITFFACLIDQAKKEGWAVQGEPYMLSDGRQTKNQMVVKYEVIEL